MGASHNGVTDPEKLAAVVQAFAVKYFERYRTQRGWPAAEKAT